MVRTNASQLPLFQRFQYESDGVNLALYGIINTHTPDEMKLFRDGLAELLRRSSQDPDQIATSIETANSQIRGAFANPECSYKKIQIWDEFLRTGTVSMEQEGQGVVLPMRSRK